MWSNTFPFVEGHLLPSGAWFQNPDGPKRFHLWCMSAQFPLLCTLALCCFRWFFWGLLVRVLLHYQKLSPTVLLHLPSHSFFFFYLKEELMVLLLQIWGLLNNFQKDTYIKRGKYLDSPFLNSLEKIWVGLGISEHKKLVWVQNVDSGLPSKEDLLHLLLAVSSELTKQNLP